MHKSFFSHSDGVELIKDKKDVAFQVQNGQFKQATYVETQRVYVYKCAKCGFLALWEHEL